jgi:hypothetical protein
MIAKQIQGSDFKKVLNYVHHKSGAKLIGGNMVGQDPESLTDEFRISSDLKRTVIQCVYHVSLSISPSEKLSEPKWIDIARTYLQGMEFQTNQYAIYRHTDREHDHIHIIASRIRITDGSVVSDSWNYRRSEKLVRQLEEQFGLSQTQCSWEKNKRSPKTGEIRKQRRTGELNKRSQLQVLIKQSLNDSPTWDEFIDRLSAQGVSVRLRKSKEGKIEGISYGVDSLAFQGRQLGKDYAWTSLESLLSQESSYQPSQNRSLPPPEALALPDLQDEISVATLATDHSSGETGGNTPSIPCPGTAYSLASSGEKFLRGVQVPCPNRPPASCLSTPASFDNQEGESKEIEQQKESLRAKYVSLASQIHQFPQFQPRETRDIDLGVTLLLLKAGESLEEAKMVLTQSDRVRQWNQELPREAFIDVAKQYIRQVTNQANALLQKHQSKEKIEELE